MPKISHVKTSFVGGEFGQALLGRTDIVQYDYACEIIENMLIRPYGSVITTPGTEYINETKYSASGTDSTVRIIPFIFSRTQANIIEVGDKYFRFYTGGESGGIVISAGTTVFELAHSYSEDELFELQFIQINDVIYITHESHKTQKLTRLASNNWTIADYAFTAGPFMDDNIDDTKSLTLSNSTGTINVTSSGLFIPSSATTKGHQDSFWKIGGTRTHSTTGLPVQGYIQMTDIIGVNAATASVIKQTTVTGSTTNWAEGAWSYYRGWPARVCFHESRLFFARTDTEPQKIWGSKSFAYENFQPGAEDDDGLTFELASEESNDIKWLASGRNLIAGTYGGEFVIKSGDDSPLTPTSASAKRETSWGSEPIPPKKIGNFFYYVQRFGRKVRELFYFWDLDNYKSADKTILSPHITGDGVVDMAYQQNPDTILWCVREDGQIATFTREIDQEVQGWSRQITDGYYESVAVIPSPDGAYDEVWVVVRRTIDGNTKRYIERFANIEIPDRQDLCWYVHSGLRYSAYEHTEDETADISLSNTSGTITITTSTTYFLATDVGKRIRAIDSEGATIGEAKVTEYTSDTEVEATTTYDFDSLNYDGGEWGISVDELEGLDHLEGETVTVLADGGLDKPDKEVESGEIELEYDYFIILVGLPYDQTVYTLPIETGSQRGTAQGKKQRINEVALKVNRSYKGFLIGGNEDLVTQAQFRDPSTLMGTPEELYTGILPNMIFKDDYRYGSQVMIKNSDPLPLEILSIAVEIETFDK